MLRTSLPGDRPVKTTAVVFARAAALGDCSVRHNHKVQCFNSCSFARRVVNVTILAAIFASLLPFGVIEVSCVSLRLFYTTDVLFGLSLHASALSTIGRLFIDANASRARGLTA